MDCLKHYELVLLAEGRASEILEENFKKHEQHCPRCSKEYRNLSAIHKTMKPLFDLRELDRRGWRVSTQKFFDF